MATTKFPAGETPYFKIPVLRGIVVTFLIIFLLTFFFTLLLSATDLYVHQLDMSSPYIAVIALLFGSIVAAKGAEANFLLNGLSVSVLYVAATFLLAIVQSGPMDLGMMGMKTIYCLGAGLIGGIVGAFFN